MSHLKIILKPQDKGEGVIKYAGIRDANDDEISLHLSQVHVRDDGMCEVRVPLVEQDPPNSGPCAKYHLTRKARDEMLSVIDEQLAQPKNPKDDTYYTLGDLKKPQLEVVKRFISSFCDPTYR